MRDPETRYAAARANYLMRQREYNEAVSRLIAAEREVREAMVGTAYATAVAAMHAEERGHDG
jgi:thermostable 8-oxoguanine DNA glycosylase